MISIRRAFILLGVLIMAVGTLFCPALLYRYLYRYRGISEGTPEDLEKLLKRWPRK